MSGSRVSVVGAGGDIQAAVRKGVKLLGALEFGGTDRVVIKPNVCNARNPYSMVNTDLQVIEAVIDLVRETTGDVTVVESDNISGPAERRAEESGLLESLRSLGVDFLNLSGDDYEVYEVAGTRLRLPKTILEADFFVNLPKIKTCGHTLVTLSMKNLFGVVQRANKKGLHRHLDEILPYLAKVVRHGLIIVDGVTAMEGNGPVIGTPRRLGVVVAGFNPVSVDSVCSRMMGFDPAEIGHMARAHGMGLGEIELDEIDVVGEDWRRFAHDFERPYSLKATLKSVKTISKIYL